MNFLRQVSRALDDEHRANLEVLARVEHVLARGLGGDPQVLAGQLSRQLETEVARHFAFEEEHLFPLMAASGDGDLGTLLAEEHDTIRAVVAELQPLLRRAAAGSMLDERGTAGLRRLAGELVERLVAHIEKETMALLPLLDDLLDEETDRELAFGHAAA